MHRSFRASHIRDGKGCDFLLIGIQEEILRLHSQGLLDRLLLDKTTRSNILWGTEDFVSLGSGYERDAEIMPDHITGDKSGVIKTHARRKMELQSRRNPEQTAAYPPLPLCEKMNNYSDELWSGLPAEYGIEKDPSESLKFTRTRHWKRYVNARKLVISCGEAPYLVSRYDPGTGEYIPIKDRTGLLDRKLRIVDENTADEETWLLWTRRAYQSIYGYEFRGDSLLIARINMLLTFEEHLYARWGRCPTAAEYREFSNVIAWNLWQMDGLTSAVPYSLMQEGVPRQLALEGWQRSGSPGGLQSTSLSTFPYCWIRNWWQDHNVEFRHVMEGSRKINFELVTGVLPLQNEAGDRDGFSPSGLYGRVLNNTYEISEHTVLIYPAKFLFRDGVSQEMLKKGKLKDKSMTVLCYEPDSRRILPDNSRIEGGLVITSRTRKKNARLPVQTAD